MPPRSANPVTSYAQHLSKPPLLKPMFYEKLITPFRYADSDKIQCVLKTWSACPLALDSATVAFRVLVNIRDGVELGAVPNNIPSPKENTDLAWVDEVERYHDTEHQYRVEDV